MSRLVKVFNEKASKVHPSLCRSSSSASADHNTFTPYIDMLTPSSGHSQGSLSHSARVLRRVSQLFSTAPSLRKYWRSIQSERLDSQECTRSPDQRRRSGSISHRRSGGSRNRSISSSRHRSSRRRSTNASRRRSSSASRRRSTNARRRSSNASRRRSTSTSRRTSTGSASKHRSISASKRRSPNASRRRSTSTSRRTSTGSASKHRPSNAHRKSTIEPVMSFKRLSRSPGGYEGSVYRKSRRMSQAAANQFLRTERCNTPKKPPPRIRLYRHDTDDRDDCSLYI